MNNNILISICIPSYNRPQELNRLLRSIDTKFYNEVQIVICEDNAPKRFEIRNIVNEFSSNTKYNVKYIENPVNYGHGKNLRECIFQADGEYVLFMGDDDVFIPDSFDLFYDFVHKNTNIGYFLRSYASIEKNSKPQYFRYYSSNKYFEPGLYSYIHCFGKSVSMSGFTIKRDYVKDYTIDLFDDSLLFQLYLVAEVCLNYPAAYFNTPFTYVISDGGSFFGTNEKEKYKYEVGVRVSDNINFILGRYKITEFIDNKYSINSTQLVQADTSKYCFYILAESRKYGLSYFLKKRKMFLNAGLDKTFYFHIYFSSLFFIGVDLSTYIIKLIKRIVGRRLHL